MRRFVCGLLFVSCLCLVGSPAPAPAQKGAKDILTTLKTIAVFKSWAKVVEVAGLDKLYGTAKPVITQATMFAPNEDAFAKLKDDEKAMYFDAKNKAKLIALVTHHTIEGQKIDIESLGKKGKFNNSLLRELTIKKDDDGNFKIEGALVVTPDVPATNGVIHGLDSFLMPLK